MTDSAFFDPATFVRAPRLIRLQASRAGRIVVTRSVVSEDGTAFLSQLFEVTEDSARQLTFGTKSASLLAVGERGEVYFSRSDPEESSKGGALWMLPPTGEAREIFRYHGGIEGLSATQNSLLLTLTVSAQAAKTATSVEELLSASTRTAKQREEAKTSAVLHAGYPTRYWAADHSSGIPALFISPLPPLDAPLDLTGGTIKKGGDSNEDEAAATEKDTNRHLDSAASNGAAENTGEGKSGDQKSPSWRPGELKLSRLLLPEVPGGVHQWKLNDAQASVDGSRLVIEMGRRHRIEESSELWVAELPKGEFRPLHAAPGLSCYLAALSPDGAWAIVSEELPPLPGQTIDEHNYRADLTTGLLTPAFDHEWSGIAIGDNDTIYLTSDRQGRGGIFRVHSSNTDAAGNDGNKSNDFPEVSLLTPEDEYAYSNLAWAKDKLVALRSSIAEPPAVVFIDPHTGAVTKGPRLTQDIVLPGTLIEVSATALDGTPLRSWLVLPEGKGPHPLVVFAHGGPWGSWNDWTWRWNPWVFAARGYAILLPDPGISTGYGRQMLSRGHDSIGDEPFTDILALADSALERDDIDADCQLFAGGSYGGYMANWVAGHTGKRFKGIVTHASLWNIESMGRTTDNGSWYPWMMGPLATADSAGKSQAELWSPHLFVEDIEVPMLVIHGDKDYRVPISQGLELWFDLQRTSPDLDHQYLYFPDEGHWILKPGNAQVWYQSFLAFLDAHAKGEDFQTPELLA